MKYAKSEQKKADYHEKEIFRYEKMILKEQERFAKLLAKHNNRISEIRKYKSDEQLKISKINMRVKKRCKHLGERKHWRNMRDDASFEFFVRCVDCEEIMWEECK